MILVYRLAVKCGSSRKTALILSAVIKLGKKSLVDIGAVVIFLIVTALAVLTDLSPAIFVVAAGAAGLLLKGGVKRDASA